MDYQEYTKVTVLQRLFDAFVSQKKIALQQITHDFALNESEILLLIKQLANMGLKLHYDGVYFSHHYTIDALDGAIILQNLRSRNIELPLFFQFSLPSTYELAKDSKKAGVFLCEYQSKGHGKQSSVWHAPVGRAILLSMNYHLAISYQALAGLNIAIAVAIIKTAAVFGQTQLQLKWSNDVFLHKKKAAGILINISPHANGKIITIGIGINWQLQKHELNRIEQKSTNISIKNTKRSTFISELIYQIDTIIQEFSQSQLHNILPLWHEKDMCLNKTVTVSQDNKTWHARYLGVNKHGLAVLEKPQSKELSLLASGSIRLIS